MRAGDCADEERRLRRRRLATAQSKNFCCGSKLARDEKRGIRRQKTHLKTDLVICLDRGAGLSEGAKGYTLYI